jgi:hypothetical protein
MNCAENESEMRLGVTDSYDVVWIMQDTGRKVGVNPVQMFAFV